MNKNIRMVVCVALAAGVSGGLAMAATPAYAAFQPVRGCATSIGVGANGDAWVTGCGLQGSAGYPIYQMVNGTFVQQPGLATQIAVSASGTPWVVNGLGGIFEWNGASSTRSQVARIRSAWAPTTTRG